VPARGYDRVLPDVLDAVGSDAEVFVDSGVRRGGDVVKALALGARAVLIGRASAYGFMAAGEDGVRRILEVIRDELDQALAYIGCPGVRELDSSYVDARQLT
jgi:isopentenyl diphosphate isomerase/L-lactate dehydrogenase-like FMN-dependent dehydrogenase